MPEGVKRAMRSLRRALGLGLLALLPLAMGGPGASAEAPAPLVRVLEVKGPVNPPLASYIQRGIRVAEEEGASAVVVLMDTPGGLMESMREIVGAILNARVPVIVYVHPPGARAASAGTFIGLSAHLLAMAPNTTIGAASPVAMGTGGTQPDETLMEKVTNDAVAYIRSLAEGRGRNADWAEEAVRKGVAVDARTALDLGVIDLLAPDLPTLLREADGREVEVAGERVALRLEGARLQPLPMSPAERFLFVISNPNIAFLLLSLAMLAIFFELANPGAILPGVLGGILLFLSLYALGTLSVNWAGVLLILLAFALFVGEIFVASGGLLAIGGVASFVLGGLMLFSGARLPGVEVNLWLVAALALALAGFFLFVVGAVVRAHRQRPALGYEGMVGEVGIAKTRLNPEGFVLVHGERWRAMGLDAPVEPGEEVVVERVEGLRVFVRRRAPHPPPAPSTVEGSEDDREPKGGA